MENYLGTYLPLLTRKEGGEGKRNGRSTNKGERAYLKFFTLDPFCHRL